MNFREMRNRGRIGSFVRGLKQASLKPYVGPAPGEQKMYPMVYGLDADGNPAEWIDESGRREGNYLDEMLTKRELEMEENLKDKYIAVLEENRKLRARMDEANRLVSRMIEDLKQAPPELKQYVLSKFKDGGLL